MKDDNLDQNQQMNQQNNCSHDSDNIVANPERELDEPNEANEEENQQQILTESTPKIKDKLKF